MCGWGDGGCVNTQNDNLHCGTCGRVCLPGDNCEGGRCWPSSCQAGLTLCERQCVDLTSEFWHCGACGERCWTGAECRDGKCTGPPPSCPSHQTLCGIDCVNPGVDNRHCGGCDQACDSANGENCVSGVCTKP